MNKRKRFWFLAFVSGVLFVAGTVNADVRADYLIGLLKNGSSYRVKIQAAQSLGRIQCKEAVPALEKALNDQSPHVVMAAAAALGEIGDASVLPALRVANKKAKTAPVKTQLSATIRLLQELSPGTPASASSELMDNSDSSFLVKVDAMGNSSTSRTPGITSILKEIVVSDLHGRSGVEVQAPSVSESDVRSRIKKQKVKAFILSGALIKLNQEGNFIVAKIALNVLTNPDYNLVMMPSGEARIPIDYSAVQAARQQGASAHTVNKLEGEAVASAEKLVLKKLVENLLGKILEAAPDVL
ncbi:MAG: HEAT repeat domain-containing protein [Deltaproteobacteria bacterium]|nr:HEAT repeat domain-containing protein [Deltaproteobacteria bacterium]